MSFPNFRTAKPLPNPFGDHLLILSPGMLRLLVLLAGAMLIVAVAGDCSSKKQQCMQQCGGSSSMNFNCQSFNGVTQSTCTCIQGGGSGSGNNAENIALIVVAVFGQLICCVFACACLILCIRFAVSAIGLALICDFLILVNALLGIISIEGAIGAIWDTITDSVGLSSLTIVQLVVPLIIVVMCYANTVPTNIIALILCVITILLQVAFFSVLFAKDSIVPYVGTLSVGVGILIVACSVGIMLRVLQTLRELNNPHVLMVTDGIIGDPNPYPGSMQSHSMTQLPSYGATGGYYGSPNDESYRMNGGGGYGMNFNNEANFYAPPSHGEKSFKNEY